MAHASREGRIGIDLAERNAEGFGQHAGLKLPDAAEVTIEANPDDRSVDYFRAIRAAGVNRLSLGVQSFDDAMLRRSSCRPRSA